MKKDKKYLALYEAWMKTGKIGLNHNGTYNGLCGALRSYDDPYHPLRLFEPTREEQYQLTQGGLSAAYWGCGIVTDVDSKYSEFTPLRQTILLFLAAMSEEL